MNECANPMGLDGFEFVEFAAPEAGVIEPTFGRARLRARCPPPFQDRAPVAAERHQLHRQLPTAEHRVVSRRGARPVRRRTRLPGPRRAPGLRPRRGPGRAGHGHADGADGTEASGHPRRRRHAALPDRPLPRGQQHLRHRLRVRRRRRPPPGRRRTRRRSTTSRTTSTAAASTTGRVSTSASSSSTR